MVREYYGSIFINNTKLSEERIKYPIELKYYKTKTIKKAKTGEKYTEYGIEIIRKKYMKEETKEENNIKTDITMSEEEINKILDNMVTNEVSPIILEDVARDLLIEDDIYKFENNK